MINDIIDILKKMESACPVECWPQLHTNLDNNLVMEWRWFVKGKVGKFSIEIRPNSEECLIDAIGHNIALATNRMAHINKNMNTGVTWGEAAQQLKDAKALRSDPTGVCPTKMPSKIKGDVKIKRIITQ